MLFDHHRLQLKDYAARVSASIFAARLVLAFRAPRLELFANLHASTRIGTFGPGHDFLRSYAATKLRWPTANFRA
jgi:hypothetical protein